MSDELDEIVSGCRELAVRGTPIQEVISYLHEHGTTIIESIKAVTEVYGMSLRDAKAMVSAHPVWKDVVAAAAPLHEDLEREIKKQDD